MTKEEIQKSSEKKVQVVNNLCNQLGLVPSAEQIITPEGFIKHVVYYTDTERYELTAEPTEPEPVLAPEPEPVEIIKKKKNGKKK